MYRSFHPETWHAHNCSDPAACKTSSLTTEIMEMEERQSGSHAIRLAHRATALYSLLEASRKEVHILLQAKASK